jgi:hypothetical protein
MFAAISGESVKAPESMILVRGFKLSDSRRSREIRINKATAA